MTDSPAAAVAPATSTWRPRLSDAVALFSSALIVLGGAAWGGSFVDNAKSQDRRIAALEQQVQTLQSKVDDKLARIETKIDILTPPDHRAGDGR